MAFNSFLRRASSSIMLLPIRTIGPPRQYQSVISLLNVENRSRISMIRERFPPLVRFQSTGCGSTTNKAAAEKSPAAAATEEACEATYEIMFPDNFPFDLTNRVESSYITLKRKFQDEIIKIDVSTYQNVKDYYEDDKRSMTLVDDHDDEFYDYKKVPMLRDEMAYVNRCLRMDVKIFHGDMYRRRLKFDVLAFVDDHDHSPWIIIRRMSMSVDPLRTDEFSQLHLEDFEDFLKTRGITDSNINFLFNYLQRRYMIGPHLKLRELVRVVRNRGKIKIRDNHYVIYGFNAFFPIVLFIFFVLHFIVTTFKFYNQVQELDDPLVTTQGQIKISDNHSPRF